jgi:hypothetical protein
MPTWGWILLIVLAIIVTPIKMRILKKMLTKKEEPKDDE